MPTGSCLCGGVKFTVEGQLAPIQICHCVQCRKAQGTALVTNIPVEETAFKIQSGNEQLAFFESSPGKKRYFCKNCGSPIYSQAVKVPGVVRIRAGLLDGELETRAEKHFYISDKANWFEMYDTLPKMTQGADSPEADPQFEL
ncbi:MAG: GFA family protein [Pseudomonadales bacterium]|nr:GFA family protein [Pseudomonadales bacterium]